MKIFISWSGDLSRELAGVLREYLPVIVQELQPFMSKHDLQSGTRWAVDLAKELETTNFGILCLTPNNLTEPWIIYEAGALTKLVDGRACGVLFQGLNPVDITGPLTQFQHRAFDVPDMRALLSDLNSMLKKPLESQALDMSFKAFWPSLNEKCSQLGAHYADRTPAKPRRDEYDMLGEILSIVRGWRSSAEALGIDLVSGWATEARARMSKWMEMGIGDEEILKRLAEAGAPEEWVRLEISKVKTAKD